MGDLPLKPAITVVVSQSEGYYVASCREISAVTQGLTFDELVLNIQEAVEPYLDDENPADFGLLPNPSIVLV